MDGICLSFDFLIDVREPHPESFGTARDVSNWRLRTNGTEQDQNMLGSGKKIGEASSSSWFKVIFFLSNEIFFKSVNFDQYV